MKIIALKGELSSESKQLREPKGIISSLRMTNKELDEHAAHLFAQVLEVQKEAIAATKAAAALNEAKGVSIQLSFKVFH